MVDRHSHEARECWRCGVEQKCQHKLNRANLNLTDRKERKLAITSVAIAPLAFLMRINRKLNGRSDMILTTLCSTRSYVKHKCITTKWFTECKKTLSMPNVSWPSLIVIKRCRIAAVSTAAMILFRTQLKRPCFLVEAIIEKLVQLSIKPSSALSLIQPTWSSYQWHLSLTVNPLQLTTIFLVRAAGEMKSRKLASNADFHSLLRIQMISHLLVI